MAEATQPRTFAALVDALDTPGPLGVRLDAFARELSLHLGADVAVVVPLVDASVVAGGRADLLGAPDAASLAVDDLGTVVLVRPAAALEPAGRADAARAAVRLLARELAWGRREARALRTEDVMSAVTHEMNNALTPLLCHGCEPVVRESLRLRSLLETLRVVRGRTRPRELRWAGDLLERVKKLLGLSGSGTFAVEVACTADAAQRAIGPEQDRLLSALLCVGYALRARAQAGAPVTLRAGLDAEGRLQLEVAARVDAARELAADLDRVDGAPGFVARLRLEGEVVRVLLTLLRRPRVVVLEPPDGPTPGDAVERALRAAGIEVARARDVAGAVTAAAEGHDPAAIVLLPGAPAQALRQGLHRSQPLLASRCVVLDEQLAPRGPRPAPDEVDLGKVLASAREAPR